MRKSKANTSSQKTTFGKWLYKYRIRIFLIACVVIIPISLILIAYIGTYSSSQQVDFSTDGTEVENSFISTSDLTDFSLDINWLVLQHPEQLSDGTVTGGYYTFSIEYTPNPNFNITTFKVTPVLKTDWLNYSSEVTDASTRYLSASTPLSISIGYNYVLPQRTLLFININEANLYLKVDYNYVSAGRTLSNVVYIKYSLKNIYEGVEVDPNN